LCTALSEDHDRELQWYSKGHLIALDIARGLYFLHSHDVRRWLALEKPIIIRHAARGLVSPTNIERVVLSLRAQLDRP
jgi:hypothetical protein